MNSLGWFPESTENFDWFDLLAVQGTQVFSAGQSESINSLALKLLYGPTLISVCVSKVTSLLFNMLSVCHSLLPRSKCLLYFTAAVTICSDFEAQESKIYHCFHISICLPLSNGTRYYGLSVWILSFKPPFSLSFTLIKRLFSSFSLSAIRVVSSTYLRLLPLAIVI